MGLNPKALTQMLLPSLGKNRFSDIKITWSVFLHTPYPSNGLTLGWAEIRIGGHLWDLDLPAGT